MKAGFPTKSVLVTNASCALAQALLAALKQTKLKFSGVDFGELDWSDAQAVDALINAKHPFLVINTFSVDDKHEPSHELYAKHLANACTKIKSRVIHLSDYHVFGAESKNTYFETDKVAPLSQRGQNLVLAEQHVMEQVEQHMILRLSWLLNNTDDNPFTRLMRAFSSDNNVEVSKDYLGAPTWQSDVVRVVLGVIQQIFSGAENWGIFHYCSNDKCSELEFAQLIAQAYGELVSLHSELLQTPYGERRDLAQKCEPHSAVLSCRRIRNNFGVQARTWRQGLKRHIQEWLDHKEGDYNSNNTSAKGEASPVNSTKRKSSQHSSSNSPTGKHKAVND